MAPLNRRSLWLRGLVLALLCYGTASWSVAVHSAPAVDAELLAALKSQRQDADRLSGYLEARVGNDQVLLPALDVDYQVQINGDLAEVTVVQTFSNPLPVAITPRYLFPLSDRAAVSALVMTVGDERVVGEFQRRAQAEATFVAAAKAGKVASLVRQQRPNQFTQRVSNLMPGMQVQVALTYQEQLRREQGAYELVLPLVVGPRFDPERTAEPLDAPVRYAPVQGLTAPAPEPGERVSVQVALNAPVPILAVDSPSHALQIERQASQQLAASLAGGRVADNRDFVLRYQLGGDAVTAGLQSHFAGPEGGYFSLLIEPPATLADASVLPREMVFLLDCSGSMSGLPMQASKRFMRYALDGLQPGDSFRIIRFSDGATEFSRAPLPATPANIAAGIAYTEQLAGSGGTVMSSGIYQALAAPLPDGAVRTVVFLTDGYIGNEVEILKLVAAERHTARLYAFGVGTGVNRFLLESLARTGQGFARYLDPTDDSDEVARSLAARLAQPVLTDLTLDWGGLPVGSVVPETLPDLYAGQSLRVMGRYRAPAAGRVELRARSASGPVRFGLDVALEDAALRPALRQVWARQAVAQRMHELATPEPQRVPPQTDAQLRERVTVLGETYGLMTRWTSLVAVAARPVQPFPDATALTDVALPMVAGVSPAAYGVGGASFQGAGTPEPGVLLGFGTLCALGFLGWLRWRRWQPRTLAAGA
jgi:Ca-activated chloride channel family protein